MQYLRYISCIGEDFLEEQGQLNERVSQEGLIRLAYMIRPQQSNYGYLEPDT